MPEESVAEQLAILCPQGRVLTVRGETICVPEMPLRKLAKFSELLAPVLAHHKADADLFPLLGAYGNELLAGVAHAIDRPVAWLQTLSARELNAILRALQEANASFFLSSKGKVGRVRFHGDATDRGWAWAEVFAVLIEHGHADPGALTLRQIDAYMTAIQRIEHNKRCARIVDIRVAAAEQKSFEQWMRRFEAAPGT